MSVSFKGTLRSFKRNGMLVGEEATKPLKGVNEFLFCLYRFPGLLFVTILNEFELKLFPIEG